MHILNNGKQCLLCEINSYYSFQCILLMRGRYGTDILKMCMKKFMLKKYFLTNLPGFDRHIGGGGVFTVSLACSQFLVT